MSEPRSRPLAPGFVLHRTPYRETSLLVEAFTPEGRIGLVARGARGGRARQAALFQPFVPLWLAWGGRGDLGTVTGCELRPPPLQLAGRDLFLAFYVNELLLRLTHRHDPLPELFAAYEVLLHALVAGGGEWTLRRFEVTLLAELGYGLSLEYDAEGEAVRPDIDYCYDPERGPVARRLPGTVGVSGQTLLHLALGTLPDAQGLAEARRLLRGALAPHLGDRPLHSRELYRQVFASPTKTGD